MNPVDINIHPIDKDYPDEPIDIYPCVHTTKLDFSPVKSPRAAEHLASLRDLVAVTQEPPVAPPGQGTHLVPLRYRWRRPSRLLQAGHADADTVPGGRGEPRPGCSLLRVRRDGNHYLEARPGRRDRVAGLIKLVVLNTKLIILNTKFTILNNKIGYR